MEPILIEGSQRFPRVIFDNISGKIEFHGRSIMDNPLGFYKPLYEWLEKYKIHPCDTTEVIIKLEYFNTASSKCLLNIFKYLTDIDNAGHKINITWFYTDEDEDMKEVGEDFQAMVNFTFNIVKYSR